MTALDQYQRLEAVGTWQTSGQDPVDVVVQFGEATLVLASGDDAPLTHWSLPAMTILASGDGRTVYALDNDASETLTVADEEMQAALARVLERKFIAEPRRHQRRWKLMAFLLVVGLAAIWALGPTFLARQASRLIAPERAEQIGRKMIPLIEASTGPACATPAGTAALASVAARLDPSGRTTLHVVDLGDIRVLGLPGRQLVIGREVVEDAASPEEIAGWAALAEAAAEARPAFREMFRSSAFSDGISFVTTGTVTDEMLNRLVNRVLVNAQADLWPTPVSVTQRLTAAGVDSMTLQIGLARSGIDMDLPSNGLGTTDPILSDDAWVALQEICSN